MLIEANGFEKEMIRVGVRLVSSCPKSVQPYKVRSKFSWFLITRLLNHHLRGENMREALLRDFAPAQQRLMFSKSEVATLLGQKAKEPELEDPVKAPLAWVHRFPKGS